RVGAGLRTVAPAVDVARAVEQARVGLTQGQRLDVAREGCGSGAQVIRLRAIAELTLIVLTPARDHGAGGRTRVLIAEPERADVGQPGRYRRRVRIARVVAELTEPVRAEAPQRAVAAPRAGVQRARCDAIDLCQQHVDRRRRARHRAVAEAAVDPATPAPRAI